MYPRSKPVGNNEKPFRVLSLDGGGMRGIYSATYLSHLTTAFVNSRKVKDLDVGAAFNLITGTSTGGIIACALAVGIPLKEVVQIYRQSGPSIFPLKMPTNLWGVIKQWCSRPRALKSGEQALREILLEKFGEITLGEMYDQRKIALSIPAVVMDTHRSWVFKTPHLSNSFGRDSNYRLVDACLATSAAPLFRSLAALDHPDSSSDYNVFADGGLWANNPVLVGLIDALEMAQPEQPVEIFCLGTCSLPTGDVISRGSVHRGLFDWKFGADAATLSISAQEFAFDNMARMLAKHVNHQCKIIRFPRESFTVALTKYLDLDETRSEAMNALKNQARSDAEMAFSKCQDSQHQEGKYIKSLFMAMPERAPPG